MTDPALTPVDASALAGRQLRYYDFAMAAFVAILLCSNIIGAGKQAQVTLPVIGPVIFGAGILFFPLGYVLGDIMTEVYGYARARRVVWVGFAASLFAAFMSWAVVAIPAAHGVGRASGDGGGVWASAANLPRLDRRLPGPGEFANAFVLARMKVWTGGDKLWSRLIGSTVAGQGVDSLIFYPLAFLGVWETSRVFLVLFTNFGLKVLWEIILMPVTYRIVAFFKRAEGLDVFDRNTDFTPFKAKV